MDVLFDVGGVLHRTTRATVSCHAPHMLSAMIARSEEAVHFIDRNGNTFGSVLDFLRSGHLSKDRDHLMALRVEADFFSIGPMLVEIDALLAEESTLQGVLAACQSMERNLQLLMERAKSM